MSHFDCIVIGSGFGGSVAALRLTEKGYRVLVLEKGKRFQPEDFPKTNWELNRWMWLPKLGMKGIFQMSFFEHVTILHGVGVGGGSLVYANTLPMPKEDFFRAPSWAHLADWSSELAPHYATAKRMLGAATNVKETLGDRVLRQVAKDTGREEHFHAADVGVFFGTPGQSVADPYFGGQGPDRTGCTHCGACMTGCRVGAKNTLDRNYLFLAEKLGCRIQAETEVTAVRPQRDGTYAVETRDSFSSQKEVFTANKVFFAGGVMGTIPLLLAMKEAPDGLPRLSNRLGQSVRTNSEALIGVVSSDKSLDFSEGIAITSILHTDDHSHIEPVRYGRGSGFFRVLSLPHSPGETLVSRLQGALRSFLAEPITWLKTLSIRDFAKQSQVMLYMRTLEGTLSLQLGRSVFTGFQKALVTKIEHGQSAPLAFMKEATDLAKRFAEKVHGVTVSIASETLLGVPSTAHILGGACMGHNADEGVIDQNHRVFGYDGLYVVDGAAVSANPGVNPSLTITALAERAMSFIPAKNAL